MDTIVALSTPWGRSAIGVIRLSGPDSHHIANRVCPVGPEWLPRRASVRTVVDSEGTALDDVVAVWMPGPRSYTGEDIVELSGHGNPVILAAIVDACIAAGARPARHGEFTRRALENGQTSILKAESLQALIDARTLDGVRDARDGMDGSMDRASKALRESLLDIAAELEARLDHPDDDLSLQSDESVAAALRDHAEQSIQTADTWMQSKVKIEGASVALIGPVNAGKSSLFNHLVGSARALVSDRPGTTRDVVERSVVMGGMDITFLDTAGEGGTDDSLELAGVALGQSLSEAAQLRLVVVPSDRPVDAVSRSLLERHQNTPHLVVGSFGDRPKDPLGPATSLLVDNVTGSGVDAVASAIRSKLTHTSLSPGGAVVMSQRQHDLFRSIAQHCIDAAAALEGALGPAVAAAELVFAIERLGELEGIDAREAVLDRLFSRFCIGK